MHVVAGVLKVAEHRLQRTRGHLGVQPLVVEEHVLVQAGEAARAHQMEGQLAELENTRYVDGVRRSAPIEHSGAAAIISSDVALSVSFESTTRY